MHRKVTNVVCYIWSLGAIKNTLYSIFLEFVFVLFKLNKNIYLSFLRDKCWKKLLYVPQLWSKGRYRKTSLLTLKYSKVLNSIKQTVTWLSCNVILFNFSFRQSLPPSWFKILRSHGHICQGNKLVSLHQWNWR